VEFRDKRKDIWGSIKNVEVENEMGERIRKSNREVSMIKVHYLHV
jgi:hypothetical protein